MSMTGKSRSATPSGTSTEQIQELISASVQSRIALALLKQAVLDLAGKDIKLRAQAAYWLNSAGAKEVCAAIPVDYQDLWEEMKYLTFRPSHAQRISIARTIIKSFPKI